MSHPLIELHNRGLTPLQPGVDLVQAAVDLAKAPVELLEPFADQAKSVVDFSFSTSSRSSLQLCRIAIHDASLTDKTLHVGVGCVPTFTGHGRRPSRPIFAAIFFAATSR